MQTNNNHGETKTINNGKNDAGGAAIAAVNSAEEPEWHAMTVAEACAVLGVNEATIRRQGLSTSEAQERLHKYGSNQLTEKEKERLWQRIWRQVNNLLVVILLFVAVVSLIRGIIATDPEERLTDLIEVGLISIVVVLNTIIGIYQEGSAAAAAEALKNMLSADALVIRDGKEVEIPAEQVVPGDIVIVNTGDRVPADIRLLKVNNLSALEAALTGEAVPIDKSVEPIVIPGVDPRQTPLGDRKNMCFSATLISQGYGVGLVIATGDETEIGTINKLVNDTETKKTAVLEQIDFFAQIVAGYIAVVAIVTWFVAYFMTPDVSALEAISTALICAVAMIPEGLQAIVTVTYSWSVATMAQENAIIRVLPAVETLGSVTTICSDKTGTLTKNEMSLVAFVTSNAHYKFDVDSQTRTARNFVRDDDYLDQRAGHTKMLSIRDVIQHGPSASRSLGERGKSDFGFSMHGTSGHSDDDDDDDDNYPIPEQKLPAAEPIPVGSGQSPPLPFVRQALAGGVLCSKCTLGKSGGREGEIGNPTELAILRAAYFSDIDVGAMKQQSPILAEVPFSSEYKFMATVHEPLPDNDGAIEEYYDGKYVVHVKGAPDRMIKQCKYQAKAGLLGTDRQEPIDLHYWMEHIAILSSHGLRVLALCRGVVDKSEVQPGDPLKPDFVLGRGEPWLTIVGLCAIQDPPRPECIRAIQVAHTAGVRVVMITGDHKDTALAIGRQLGIVDEHYSGAMTGPELDELVDEEMKTAVMNYNVFARASPENKIRIVKALQARGEVCSMTGDGVNDAPALKAADIGVAMGKEGTDVAREASEMILADDNFASIVVAVREGRVVWDNLRKVLFINQPIANAQGMTVLFGIICGLSESPLTPIQVLFCNLVTGVSLGFVAAVEPAEDGIMTKPPRRVGKRLIGRYLLLRIIIATIALVATTIGSVFWIQNRGYDMHHVRSQALNTLSFGAIALTMSARFAHNSAFHPRSFHGNRVAIFSYAMIVMVQILITYTPGLNNIVFSMAAMDGVQWGIVALFMFFVFLVMEGEKAVRRYLSDLGEDVDDLEYDERFDAKPRLEEQPQPNDSVRSLPKTHLRLAECKR